MKKKDQPQTNSDKAFSLEQNLIRYVKKQIGRREENSSLKESIDQILKEEEFKRGEETD